MPSEKAQFIYLVGPTAVGKTELSLKIANVLSLPIINSDSVQVYKHVDIGTAKPSKEELKQATHYLFDYVDEPIKQTASVYVNDVVDLIEKQSITKALFVGGSGFYVQALQKGLYPNSQTPKEIKDEVELWVDEKGFDSLYAWIKEKDLEFSQKISANDHYRIRRAVEVMKTQNKTMTELKSQMSKENLSPLPENRSLKIGLRMDKENLRKRVELRTQKMLDQGLVEEVRGLQEKGLSDWAPMQSVGYKEVQEFLGANQRQEELYEKIVTSTMQLIKKQMTWFKKDPEIKWFTPKEMDQATQLASEWLKSLQ